MLCEAPPLVSDDGAPCDAGGLADAWNRLCAVTAAEWLRRLHAAYARTDARVAPGTMRTHLATLRLLHERVFGPRTDGDAVPVDAGITALGLGRPVDDDDASGDDNDEDQPTDPTTRLMAQIRCHTVAVGDTDDGAPRSWSFSPAEMGAILDAAVTTPERLAILLLATTGLRLGGLCRARCAVRAHCSGNAPRPQKLSIPVAGAATSPRTR